TFSNTRFEGTAETGMKLLNPMGSAESSGSLENRRGKYPDSGSVITDHYTGIGEVMGVYYLADLFYRIRRPFQVRRSLSLTWEDLKTHNTIFLGSPAENLILREQLPQTQDFLFKVIKSADHPPTFGIENTKVQPGEQPVY